MAPSHAPLLLLALGTLLAAAAAASHHTSPANTHAHLHHHGHHHRSPMMTATARINTAPTMHQNHLESEESQSLLVVDPFTPVAAQASSGEEAMEAMGAAATAADPVLLDPPQAPSPSPSFDPAADLASLAPPQPQAEAEWSATGMAAAPPTLGERAAVTMTLPLPNQYTAAASPPIPIHASAAGMVTSGDDQGLQQLARVLTSLGYNEMASAAALLDGSPSVARWPGAMTVFAAPDVFLQAACPGCSLRHLLLEHIALGYFPYSELAAVPTVKLPSASMGFCLNVAAEQEPFVVHHVSLYVDGVEVSYPELYNDGRYVVHGLHGFVPPHSHTSCYEGSHHRRRRHHLVARSAASSGTTTESVVRTRYRQAMARLRHGGFGFVSLAMRVNFAELEKLANLTVFALDDKAIFTSGGGPGYAAAVRFHIVPDQRLTRADLLRLRPGTTLPTLAGEDQKLVITHGAGSGSDEVRINNIPVKEPDVMVNSRVAVHGIYVPFPRLRVVNHTGEGHEAAASLPAGSSSPEVDAPPHVKTTAAAFSGAAHAGDSYRRGHSDRYHVTMKVVHSGGEAHEDSGGHGAGAAAASVGAVGLAALAINQLIREKRRKRDKERKANMLRRHVKKLKKKFDGNRCRCCQVNDNEWRASCCNYCFCSLCVVNGFLDSHVKVYRKKDDEDFCGGDGYLVPVVPPSFDPVYTEYFFTGEEADDGHYMKVKTLVNLNELQARQPPRRLCVWYKKTDNTRLNALVRSPQKKVLPMD